MPPPAIQIVVSKEPLMKGNTRLALEIIEGSKEKSKQQARPIFP